MHAVLRHLGTLRDVEEVSTEQRAVSLREHSLPDASQPFEHDCNFRLPLRVLHTRRHPGQKIYDRSRHEDPIVTLKTGRSPYPGC
jgi:hypothetical protein